MREDMKYILTSNGKHSKSWDKTTRDYKLWRDPEDAPSMERMTLRYPHRWGRGRNIGGRAIGRYLVSQTGRLWNDVYAEICENMNGKDGFEIRKYCRDQVEFDVFMKDGKPYHNARGYKDKSSPVTSYRRHGISMYVNPDNGLLLRAPKDVKVKSVPLENLVINPNKPLVQYRMKVEDDLTTKRLNPKFGHKYSYNEPKFLYDKKQVWYALELGDRPEDVEGSTYKEHSVWYKIQGVSTWTTERVRVPFTFCPAKDAYFHDVLTAETAKFYYGSKHLYCLKVRHPNSKELKYIRKSVNN